MTSDTGRAPISDQALEGLAREAGSQERGRVDGRARWPSCGKRSAGPIVGAHTTGVHLRDGALVVYVDSHAWANDMSALSERYRTEMNSGLGKELISRVSFTVSRKVARGAPVRGGTNRRPRSSTRRTTSSRSR